MRLTDNLATPTMLQSVTWLFFCFRRKSNWLKIENWKFQSIFNIWFSAKTFQIVDRTTPGVHSHGTFFCAPSPLPTASLPSLGTRAHSMSASSQSFVASQYFATSGNLLWMLGLFVAQFCPLRWATKLSMWARRKKNLRLRIRAGDVAISRLPPTFQTPYCKTGSDWIGFVKRGIRLVGETWYIFKTSLEAGCLDQCNGVFKK